jgi:Mce-associated membrane protein
MSTAEETEHAETEHAETEQVEAGRVESECAEAECAEALTEAGDTAEARDTAEAGDAAEATPESIAEPAAAGAAGRLRRVAAWPRRRLAAVATLAAAALLSGGLLYAAAELRDPAVSGNHALTDAAATDQVAGEISNALSRIFAYTPDDTQSTAQAARDVLDGAAATQYQALFGQIRQQVASQRLTLTTRVVRAGVVSLTASRARLLVFLDQTAQRAGGAPTSAAAQLSVTAEFKGGHWRITELTAR